MSEVPLSLTSEWPVGPVYTEWVATDGRGAWVAYKLGAAEWFIVQLERVGDMVGYHRYVGVEMALDGALAAMCGAFDAGVGGLIHAVESYFDSEPIPPHLYEWKRGCKQLELLKAEDLNLDVAPLIEEITEAMAAPPSGRLGWLVEFQRLRNAAIHQDTLARGIEVVVREVVGAHDVVGAPDVVGATYEVANGGEASYSIIVQGRSEHPVEYLREIHGRLTELTNRMVNVIDFLCPNGVPTSRRPPQSLTDPAGIGQSSA